MKGQINKCFVTFVCLNIFILNLQPFFQLNALSLKLSHSTLPTTTLECLIDEYDNRIEKELIFIAIPTQEELQQIEETPARR